MTQAKEASRALKSSEATDLVVPAKSPAKSLVVINLLQREQGATLAELVEATGWQAHTTRAMLTRLRKRRHAIERRKRDDMSCYHLPLGDA